MPAKSSPARKTPPGRNVEEWERKTQQRKLRLLPSVDAVLDARAKARGLTVSAYVSALVMADVAAD